MPNLAPVSPLRLLLASIGFFSLGGLHSTLAQVPSDSLTGLKFAGLPVLGYNSDEGLNYGLRLSLVEHSTGQFTPYLFTVEGQFLATQAGRVDGFLFFDTPHLLPNNQRLTAQVQYHEYNQAPFYGIGNSTAFNEQLTETGHPAFIDEAYYQFERTRFSATLTYQRQLSRLRLIGGLGIQHTVIEVKDSLSVFDIAPNAQAPGLAGGFTNFLKVGASVDTRDFEPAPSRGLWTDIVAEVASPVLGSSYTYARLTFTHRSYHALHPRVVFAERLLLEKTIGTMPFFEMAYHGGSFRGAEALGGSRSLRGHAQNRFLGPDKLLINAELRWRYWDFSLLNQAFFGAASLFVDSGRVFSPDEPYSIETDSFLDFHTAYGIGLHGGWNETFIVTLNVGRSSEISRAIYMSIGYLF